MELEFSLPDGTPILVRPITPEDKSLLRDGFRLLSAESRYRRFFHLVDHLSASQLRYFTEVDGRDHVAYVAVFVDQPTRGLGVARWVRLPREPSVAEGAVTVIDRYHGLGIGKTLLYVIAREALAKGVTSFRAWVVGENFPMMHVLQQLGARPGRWEQGTMELTIPLPATVEELDQSAAPLILKAVARGAVEGQTPPGKPHGTRLQWVEPSSGPTSDTGTNPPDG